MRYPLFGAIQLTPRSYQNHRRYVQSFDPDQLRGKKRTVSQINDGNCKPVTSSDGKAYYPCGLIANSYFNDTYNGGKVTLLNPANGESNATYQFSENNIAWHGLAKQYVERPYGNISDYLPPPNWHERFPNGYTEENFPNLEADEHFHVWMRVAALPTFRKLWARNDDDVMKSGTYEAIAMMSECTAAAPCTVQSADDPDYPVKQFGGTKSILISTVAWIGGKQPFLGWAYVAVAILCVALAIAGLIRHFIRPRKLGDMSRECPAVTPPLQQANDQCSLGTSPAPRTGSVFVERGTWCEKT